jgi:hypothetical protein
MKNLNSKGNKKPNEGFSGLQPSEEVGAIIATKGTALN